MEAFLLPLEGVLKPTISYSKILRKNNWINRVWMYIMIEETEKELNLSPLRIKLRELDPRLEPTINFLHQIGFLLSLHIVNGIELTPDQKQYLYSIVIESMDIAETLGALATSSPLPWDSPDNNNINYQNKTYREMIERRVEELIKLRALISYASPDIVGCCQYVLDSEVKNEIDLLNALLWRGVVNRFSICLETYKEISNKKIIQKVKTDIKLVQAFLEDSHYSPLAKLKIPSVPDDAKNPYLRFIGDYYELLSESGDKEARRLFQEYVSLVVANNQYALKKRRRKIKPSGVNPKNFVPYRCYAWYKGKKIFAGGGGTYKYPDPQQSPS